MKRILSGIRANSDLTIGNYLGALRPWVELQNNDNGSTEYFFFVPNLHSLMSRPDPGYLRINTLSNIAWFLAAGLDPAKVTLFVQSQVPAHAETAWIFNNFVTMGELNRMTQFKDKARKTGTEGQLVALYTYPTLMASDILLYDPDEVPVGDDQRQHVELARDIADRFNNIYGPTFKLPKAVSPQSGARIMNLQNPASKMSKSDEDSSGNLMLADSPEVMKQKIKRAVTDSGSDIVYSKDKPAITNLLEIFSGITGRSVKDIVDSYAGTEAGYGALKEDLASAVVKHMEPIQQRHEELMADTHKLEVILDDGRVKASAVATEKLAQVKASLGLL